MTDEPKLSEPLSQWIRMELPTIDVGQPLLAMIENWAYEAERLERELAEAKQQAQLAREAVLEESCSAVCEYCRHPDWFVDHDGLRWRASAAQKNKKGKWFHVVEDKYGSFTPADCDAGDIRTLSGTDHLQVLIGAAYRAMRDKVDELTDTYEGWIRPSDYLRALTELENADAAKALAAHEERIRREARLEEAKWWEHLVIDCANDPLPFIVAGRCMYCDRIAQLEAECAEGSK